MINLESVELSGADARDSPIILPIIDTKGLIPLDMKTSSDQFSIENHRNTQTFFNLVNKVHYLLGIRFRNPLFLYLGWTIVVPA